MIDKLFTIEVPNFITQVQLSAARKPIYYELKGRHAIPDSKSKHIHPNGKSKFVWLNIKIGSKLKVLLCDYKTSLPIIKNARSAGTAKYVQIKGNLFYSGFSHYSLRTKIIEAIKDSFRPHFKGKVANTFPIYLEFVFHDTLRSVQGKNGNKTQDLDNLSFAYVKSGQDLMTKMKIIPDDNLLYIRKVSYEFIDSKDKKLIINAYKYENFI